MTRRVDPLMPAAGDWLQSLDFCCDTLSMALQATAFSFDSNRPCLLERGKPGAFKQIALENALSCRNVSHIYGKHTTYRYAVCGVDHTVSLISDRPCLLVSIIGPGAFHQAKQPRFAVGHAFRRAIFDALGRHFSASNGQTRCMRDRYRKSNGHAAVKPRPCRQSRYPWYGDFWAKITTLTGPPVETKGR